MKGIVRILSLFVLIFSITSIVYRAEVLATYRSDLATGRTEVVDSDHVPIHLREGYEIRIAEEIKKMKEHQVKEGIPPGPYIIAFTSAAVFTSTFFIKKKKLTEL